MNNFGFNLKKIRTKKGITQTKLAQLTGLTNDYISKLENGRRDKPSIEVATKISEALDCSIYDLTEDDFNNADNTINVPKKFTIASEARQYIRKHKPVLASDNVDKISDEKAIKMANEMLYAIELVSYKYIEQEGNDNEN